MSIDYRDIIIGALVVSEAWQWFRFYRFPTRFTAVRGKIAECSKCHKRVANWGQTTLGPVCVNCSGKK